MILRLIKIIEMITAFYVFKKVSAKRFEIDKLTAAFMGAYIVIITVAKEFDDLNMIRGLIYPLTFLYMLLLNDKKVIETVLKWIGSLLLVSFVQLEVVGIISIGYGDIDDNWNIILLASVITFIVIAVVFRHTFRMDKKIIAEIIVENILACAVIMSVLGGTFLVIKKGDTLSAFSAINVCMFAILTFCLIYLFQKEKRIIEYKKKEIKMEKMCSDAYEELISDMRIRQHSFDNHINALAGITMISDNIEEAREKQAEYTKMIKKENRFNKLLKTKSSPVIVGFLYKKFMRANENGILVEPEVSVLNLQCSLEIFELVDVMGVLIDNAVEAVENLENVEKKVAFVLRETESKVTIKVKNPCIYFERSKIKDFFDEGYSTKGEDRGLGLHYVKKKIESVKGSVSVDTKASKTDNFFEIELNIPK
ncbi:MAG: GHKL domain-containing protein [Lachnospiraceae bacterium]|nr:GHKL domain-containing protein [Lachnospiraceae bacterium]